MCEQLCIIFRLYSIQNKSLEEWIVRLRQGRAPVAEAIQKREKKKSDLSMWNELLQQHWTIGALLIKLNACRVHSFVVLCQSPPVLGIDTTPVEPVDHMALTVAGCAMHCQQSHKCLSLPVGQRWHYLSKSLPLSIDFPLIHVFCLYCVCSLSPPLCTGLLSIDK